MRKLVSRYWLGLSQKQGHNLLLQLKHHRVERLRFLQHAIVSFINNDAEHKE